MVVMQFRNGRAGPILACDVCKERIDNAGMAVVVHARNSDAGVSAIMYAHKGVCHDAAELTFGGQPNSGWDELTTHFARLASNVGIDRDKILDHFDTMDSMEMLP